MMPPATDDQTRMQQSMMKYMTLFMGLMFYTVACGLCLYFIVSKLVGDDGTQVSQEHDASMSPLADNASSTTSSAASVKANGSGGGRNKKQRGRR